MKLTPIIIGLLALLTTSTCLSTDNSVKSEIVRGYPCIRRQNQLYCPSPGSHYPGDIAKSPLIIHNKTTTIFHTEMFAESLYSEGDEDAEDGDEDERNSLYSDLSSSDDKSGPNQVKKRVKRELIDSFIDENKALIRRMFGEYASPEEGGGHPEAKGKAHTHYATFDGTPVQKRTQRSKRSYNSKFNDNNKVDSCESAVEIVTPYWASNSAGKIRAIVNTQHLQQAIQQEVCQSVQTKRCSGDCSCEQKYKWHRLLAYDPDDDCKGIFMDWFLFPSCCVCRCSNVLTKK